MSSDIIRVPQRYMEKIAELMADYISEGGPGALKAQGALPSAPSDRVAVRDNSLPKLAAPAGPLSLDTLMAAISHESRKNAVRASADAIKAMGDEQARVGQDQIKQLTEHMEKIEKQKHMSFWEKAFSIFTTIVSVVASVATLAVGIATANPLLIAGGVMSSLMTINSIMDLASGGELSLAKGVSAIAKACGASDQAAQWIAFGVQMGLIVVSAALSVGGAFYKAAELGEKIAKLGLTMQGVIGVSLNVARVTNIASSLVGVASGGLGVASSLNAYDANENMARSKKIEAAMEQIRESIRFERDFLEAQVRLSDKLIGDVMDIVRGCNQTQQAILRANPNMA